MSLTFYKPPLKCNGSLWWRYVCWWQTSRRVKGLSIRNTLTTDIRMIHLMYCEINVDVSHERHRCGSWPTALWPENISFATREQHPCDSRTVGYVIHQRQRQWPENIIYVIWPLVACQWRHARNRCRLSIVSIDNIDTLALLSTAPVKNKDNRRSLLRVNGRDDSNRRILSQVL